MKNLRNRFERFCYKHRHKGIPNLMLYVTLGSAVLYVMSMMDATKTLYSVFCFDRQLILQGQLWRLITCIFTNNTSNPLLVAISLFCYYTLGRAVENSWGTLRFNLFYFTGIILMDTFAMIIGGIPITINGFYLYDFDWLYTSMGDYLNLSLFIAYATLYPNTQFLLFYIIPVKAWIFALFYLGLTVYELVAYAAIFPHGLFPLVGLMNYFLFFGKDVVNVFPLSWRVNCRRLFKKKSKKPTEYKTVPFPTAGSYQASVAQPKAPYSHCCRICGRTELSNPDLEFRYCSRCNGYQCYCEDHISNHTHI